MTMHIGISGYFARPLFDDGARATRVAKLLVDERWPWPPHWCALGVVGDFTKRLRSRKVAGAKGEAWLAEQIVDPAMRALDMSRSTKQVDNHAHIYVHTGTVVTDDRWEHPFDVYGQTRAHDLPEGHSIDAWLTLMHELMTALDVGCAIMPAWPTSTMVLADTTMGSIVNDSRGRAVIDLGPGEDIQLQNRRENYLRDLLGGTHIRAPRWGTYLRKSHLDKIGGVAKVEAIEPAKIEDLGELVFIQLTELSNAISAESEAKRRALTAVLAPLLAPPKPSEAAS